MTDKAKLIGESLLDLLRHQEPKLPRGQWETNYVVGSISDSPNKQAASNACELVWSFDRGDFDTCGAVLDWWEWKSGEEFMPKECLTGEEVYRSLTAYPDLVAAAIAGKLRREDAEKGCLELARAHVVWSLLGLGPVPGKQVVDHHTDKLDQPCVLVGKAKPKFPVRRVAQAGKRGWIRNRAKGQPKRFLFLEHLAHSVMVYQALGWDLPRKVRNNCRWQVETLAAISDRWPDLPVWGFSSTQAADLRDFANAPANAEFASNLIPFLKPTSLPVQFSRYADASVVSVLLRGDSSSTDSLMLDACYASGEVRLTSADDGLRANAVRQIAWEDENTFACRAENGTGPTMRIPKPVAALAHSVISRDGSTFFAEAA